MALQYATKWKDPDVIAAEILPTFAKGQQPSSGSTRIGLLSIWGTAMYPEVAKAFHTSTKRKSKPAAKRSPRLWCL